MDLDSTMATKKAKPSRSSKPVKGKKTAPKKTAVKVATRAKKPSAAAAGRQRDAARKAVLALRDQVKAAGTSSPAGSSTAEVLTRTTPASTPSTPTPHDPTRNVALLCARAVIDKKAQNTMILELGSRGSFTDYFLISSGTNEKQVQAMADEAVTKLKAHGLMPKVEGYEGGRWILVDAGAVVLHLFHDDIRGYYRIEALWRDATRVNIPADYYTAAQLG